MSVAIITVRRSNNFEYLERCIQSIRTHLSHTFFRSCVTLFHMRGDDALARREIEHIAETHAISLHHVPAANSSHISFDRAAAGYLSAKKIRQANDFLSMLRLLRSTVCNKGNWVLLAEDDFVVCPGAAVHLMQLLHTMDPETWSGVRLSYGLNGILLSCKVIPPLVRYIEDAATSNKVDLPIDWLIETALFHDDRTKSMRYFVQQFYIYRFNLMEHIGLISSIDNYQVPDQYPRCYESQTSNFCKHEFDVHACGHSLFSPCDNKARRELLPQFDTGLIDSPAIANFGVRSILEQRATHVHHLGQLASVSVEKCLPGQSCVECCRAKNKQCSSEFFPYVNHCELLKHHFPCQVCKSDWTSTGPSPFYNMRSSVCWVSTRRGRMSCELRQDGDTQRLCPCS